MLFNLLAATPRGTDVLAGGFTALTSALDFALNNSVMLLPISIGIGCFAIKKAKSVVRR